MNKLSVLFLMTALVIGAQSKKGHKREQLVKNVEKAWAEASMNADEAGLKKLLAEDLTYTHSNAETDTKQVYIDNLKNKVRIYHKVDYEQMDVRNFGKVAVVEARGTFDVTTRGQRAPAHLRFIHVWVNSAGGWQLVAHQSTRIQ